MTSSARTRSDCGIVSPIALAVFRLMTNSNCVGCSTGRSPGRAPPEVSVVRSVAHQAAIACPLCRLADRRQPVLQRKPHKSCSVKLGEGAPNKNDRVGLMLRHHGMGTLKVIRISYRYELNLHAKLTGRGLRLSHFLFVRPAFSRIPNNSYPRGLGNSLPQ